MRYWQKEKGEMREKAHRRKHHLQAGAAMQANTLYQSGLSVESAERCIVGVHGNEMERQKSYGGV